MPAAMSAPSAALRASGVPATIDSCAPSALRWTLPPRCVSSSSRGLVEPCRIGDRDVQEARAGRRLQLAAGALGDLLAVVDDGDARRELVGLVQILRRQQDRDARRPPARGSCATRPGARSGSRPVVGSSRNSTPGVTISEAAMSSRRRMPPE